MADPGRRGALVVLSGLPGVGKTTLARAVSSAVGAVHLRIDTIESALVVSGVVAAAGGWDNVPDAGYRVAYALATDLLTAGHIVIADSVNPLPITRRSWLDAAAQAGAPAINVEIVCSDSAVHRSRVEERTSDLTGLVVPTWDEVQRREYEPWTAPVLRVDSALGVEQAVREVTTAIIAAVRCRGT